MLEITDTLEYLAIENLRSWEPPYHEEKFLNSFSQGEDFKFTVDGFHISDIEKWKSIVYESMDHDRKNYTYYKHIINEIQTFILNKNSGIVTVNYIWDCITIDGEHYNTPATVTSVYINENGDWKILNSHCSHGERKPIQ